MRLHHARLLVTDVAASIVFYRDALGLDLKWGEASIGYASFGGGNGVDLSVFQRSGQPEASATHRGDALLLSLEVENVDREYERLQDMGVSVATEPRNEEGWGIRVAYVRDRKIGVWRSKTGSRARYEASSSPIEQCQPATRGFRIMRLRAAAPHGPSQQPKR